MTRFIGYTSSVKYFTVVILVILGLVSWLSLKTPATPSLPPSSSQQSVAIPLTTPIQAGFLIYTNGVKRSFAASMYHNRAESVFLAADSPQIVHITIEGVTWTDFFQTLPMSLTRECLITGTKESFCTGPQGTLRFYINGEENADALEEVIAQNDRLLISYGFATELELAHQIQAVPNPAALDTPEVGVEQ
jgi:hypothetical protein